MPMHGGRPRGPPQPNFQPHRQHSVIQPNYSYGQGHQRDERHREEINPQLEILREIEQYFQNQADNGRDDPRRDPNNMMLKQLSGKVAEFFHHGRPMPPSKKMEIVDLIRLWMEESKDAQKEFCRYQVFEFLFDFTHTRNDNGRLELLFSLISFSISTSSQENL